MKMATFHEYSDVSLITFGGSNPEVYAPNQTLTWNSLIDDEYWTVTMSKLSING